MKLLSIAISARGTAPERKIDFRGGAEVHPFFAIGGPEGSGKSTLLQTIALHKEHLAPYAMTPGATDFVGGKEAGRFEMESEWLLEEDECRITGSKETHLVGRSIFDGRENEVHADPALVHILARYHHHHSVAKVEFLNEARLAHKRGAAAGDPIAWQRMHRLGKGSHKLAGLPKLMLDADEDKRAKVATLTEAICPQLVPNSDGQVFKTPYGSRPLAELSLSQRMAFELAATFVLVGLDRSVILFDGPERGFAVGSALRVMEALRGYAPNAQFIVATTDPGLLTIPGGKTIYMETP